MSNNIAVLGIDCSRGDISGFTVAEALAAFGYNTGNMIFSEGLFRSLNPSVRSDYHFEADSLAGCTAVVVAAANWLNETEDFGWLFESLRGLDVPVILVGLGVQTDRPGVIPRLSEGTLQLIQFASSTSGTIGVRGKFSAQVLDHYGIRNVRVVGCPSFLAKGDGPILREGIVLDDEAVILHGTRHNFEPPSLFNRYIYREAFDRNLQLLLQSELSDIYFSLGRTNNEQIMRAALASAMDCYGAMGNEISEYLMTRSRVYFNYDEWLSAYRTVSFSVGTRMHGAIAGLLGGVPSLLICHDDRTRELADVLPLPYIMAEEVDIARSLNFRKLRALVDTDSINEKYVRYRENFELFWSENGIDQ